MDNQDKLTILAALVALMGLGGLLLLCICFFQRRKEEIQKKEAKDFFDDDYIEDPKAHKSFKIQELTF